MAQIAQCTEPFHKGNILYRHSATGETKLAMAGEELPPDSESPRRKEGTWEALAADNLDRNGTIPTFIEVTGAASGPIAQFEAGFVAEANLEINLRGAIGDPTLERGGLYRIRQVRFAERKGDEHPHLVIHHVGMLDPEKFIYEVEFP